MEPLILTERLVMRRAVASDVEAMHRLLSNSEAMRYWSTPPHASIGLTERWVGSMIDPPHEESDDFIVTLGGRVIGKLGCWKVPEIGFLIDPELWGQGYASEAMAAYVERQRSLGSTELLADVDPRNAASLRLLEKHGFVETGRASGTWQVGDELCDSVYLRLKL